MAGKVAYCLTEQICVSSPQAWQETYASVYTDHRPARTPFLVAGYQSEAEAVSALELGKPSKDAASVVDRLGVCPVDRAAAVHIRRIVGNPDIADPAEAFLALMSLAEDPRCLAVPRRLFDWEDALYVDECEPDVIATELAVRQRNVCVPHIRTIRR